MVKYLIRYMRDEYPRLRVVLEPNANDEVHVKVGHVDIGDPNVLGAHFEDDEHHYEVNAIEPDAELPEVAVVADVKVTDKEHGVSVTHQRQRVPRHLREGAHADWYLHPDRKLTILGGVAVGVLTLWKIRHKHSKE